MSRKIPVQLLTFFFLQAYIYILVSPLITFNCLWPFPFEILQLLQFGSYLWYEKLETFHNFESQYVFKYDVQFLWCLISKDFFSFHQLWLLPSWVVAVDQTLFFEVLDRKGNKDLIPVHLEDISVHECQLAEHRYDLHMIGRDTFKSISGHFETSLAATCRIYCKWTSSITGRLQLRLVVWYQSNQVDSTTSLALLFSHMRNIL